MPTFEFTSPEGKSYEVEGPEGSTKEQAFSKFQEMRPELFGGKPEKKESPGAMQRFAKGFSETFSPVKAVTEEGIIPQLMEYGRRKITGEPAPKAEAPPEKPAGLKETFGEMYNFAKKDPGKFAGVIANAIVADPELLFLPEFIPARVLAGAGKMTAAAAKTADAATQAAAVAAGQSAARQLNERGKIDMNVLRQEAQNAAAMGGGARAVGAAVAPGAARAKPEVSGMLKTAREKGYTLPASELSPIGAIIDKYYKTPLEGKNAQRFVRDITAETGTEVDRINPANLTKIDNNLSSEINGLLSPHQINAPVPLAESVRTFLRPSRDSGIDKALMQAEYGYPIPARAWQDVRSELSSELSKAMQRQDGNAIRDAEKALTDWESLKGQLPTKAQADFDKWKSKYTAYKDIYEAINRNPTAFAQYQRGSLSPQDLLNAIRSRRESETTLLGRQRPQTETALLSSGLNLLGTGEPSSLGLIGMVPKIGAAAVAKPLQAAMYSRPGQKLLYEGLGQGRMAPYFGPTVERARELTRKEK